MELHVKPANARVYMHTGALVPENVTQQVWSGALASVPRNTRLHAETAYPQGVTVSNTADFFNKPGRAGQVLMFSEI